VEPLLLIAVPFPDPSPLPVPDPDLFSTFFQQPKFLTKLAFPMLKAALFPESWPLIFYLIFVLPTFYVGSGPECIMVAVPLRQKVAILVLPQHYQSSRVNIR
jgi:hypothetical protein